MWKFSDTVFMVGFFVAYIVITVMLQSEMITSELAIIGYLIVFTSAAAPTIIETHLRNMGLKVFSRNLTDYWAEVRTLLKESNKKYLMHYNLKIPDEYIPTEQLELSEINISLHTIKSEETKTYGSGYYDTLHPEKTIIYNTQQQKILGVLPYGLKSALEFLKNNKAYYTKESTKWFIPQTVRETTFGKPV